VDAREQAEKRPFEHYIIPRFTPFRKPVSQDEKEWSIGGNLFRNQYQLNPQSVNYR